MSELFMSDFQSFEINVILSFSFVLLSTHLFLSLWCFSSFFSFSAMFLITRWTGHIWLISALLLLIITHILAGVATYFHDDGTVFNVYILYSMYIYCIQCIYTVFTVYIPYSLYILYSLTLFHSQLLSQKVKHMNSEDSLNDSIFSSSLLSLFPLFLLSPFHFSLSTTMIIDIYFWSYQTYSCYEHISFTLTHRDTFRSLSHTPWHISFTLTNTVTYLHVTESGRSHHELRFTFLGIFLSFQTILVGILFLVLRWQVSHD